MSGEAGGPRWTRWAAALAGFVAAVFAVPRWVRGAPPAGAVHFASADGPGRGASPPQPPPLGDTPSEDLSRRRFLTGISIGIGAVGTAIVGVPVVGFLIGPLLRSQPDVWRAVGAIDQFKVGDTVEVRFQDPSPLPWAGVTADSAAWLRRISQTDFEAFSIHCTHLGCPIRWLPTAHLFMCPCHGGVFYEDGRVAAGPPPIPLARLQVRINNGQVEIRTRGVAITGGSLPGAKTTG